MKTHFRTDFSLPDIGNLLEILNQVVKSSVLSLDFVRVLVNGAIGGKHPLGPFGLKCGLKTYSSLLSGMPGARPEMGHQR